MSIGVGHGYDGMGMPVGVIERESKVTEAQAIGPKNVPVRKDLSPVAVAPERTKRRPATAQGAWLPASLMSVGSALMIAEHLLLGAVVLAGACLLVLAAQLRQASRL
jgi:hypothetical protein